MKVWMVDLCFILSFIISSNIWIIKNYDSLVKQVKSDDKKRISIFDFCEIAKFPDMFIDKSIYYMSYPTRKIIERRRRK